MPAPIFMYGVPTLHGSHDHQSHGPASCGFSRITLISLSGLSTQVSDSTVVFRPIVRVTGNGGHKRTIVAKCNG